MHGRINHHWLLVRIFTGDFFVHLEEVAVAGADGVLAKTLGGIAEIQINSQPSWRNATAFVADFLGGAGGNVARGEIAE